MDCTHASCTFTWAQHWIAFFFLAQTNTAYELVLLMHRCCVRLLFIFTWFCVTEYQIISHDHALLKVLDQQSVDTSRRAIMLKLCGKAYCTLSVLNVCIHKILCVKLCDVSVCWLLYAGFTNWICHDGGIIFNLGNLRLIVAAPLKLSLNPVTFQCSNLEVDSAELYDVSDSHRLLLVLGTEVAEYRVDASFLAHNKPHRSFKINIVLIVFF